MLRFDIGLSWRTVAGGAGNALGNDLGRGFRAALLAAKSGSLGVHHLFGDFTAGEINFQIDLRGYITGANNRAYKRDQAVTVNVLKTDAVLQLGITHHAGTVLRGTRQQIAVLVDHCDIVLRHERH